MSIIGTDAVTTKVVDVTPRMAREWLAERNSGNRPIRQQWVVFLASQMTKGRWEVAQPIMFAADGRLLDGQHRLSAVVASGATVPMVVARGFDSNVFGVIDQGRNRSADDLHGQMGGKNSKFACAVATSLRLGGMAAEGMSRTGNASNAQRTTRAEIAELAIERDEDIQHIFHFHNRNKSLLKTAVCAAFVRASEVYGWDAVDELVAMVADMSAPVGHPMNALIKWLVANTGSDRRSRARMPRHMVWMAAVTAIQAAIDGKRLQIVKPSKADFDA